MSLFIFISVKAQTGLQLGTSVPNFKQNDTIGKTIDFFEFKQGSYILLEFWASWCKPCRNESSNLVSIHNDFSQKNFKILSVSLDKDRAAWLMAIEKDQLTWTHVSDLKFWKNEVALSYDVAMLPSNLLISPEGIVVGRNLKGDNLRLALNEIFEK